MNHNYSVLTWMFVCMFLSVYLCMCRGEVGRGVLCHNVTGQFLLLL